LKFGRGEIRREAIKARFPGGPNLKPDGAQPTFPALLLSMKRTALASLLLAGVAQLLVPGSAPASTETSTPVEERIPRYSDLFRSSAVTLVTENDKYFAGTDRHYTNGLKLSFLGTTRLDESPRFVRAVARRLPTLRDEAGSHLYKVGVSLGQNIYTPGDTESFIPDPADRPYAGWLYSTLDFQARSLDGKSLRLVEIAFGVVGPAALGREAQNGFHDIIQVPQANGWDYQLENEPGLMVSWERRHRLLRLDLGESSGFSTDFIGRYGLSLGNIRTNLAGGFGTRIGWRLPEDFGADLIRPSGGDEAPASAASVYFFASTEVRAVARNIFLDGNTWRDSRSVDKRPIVADFNAGLVFRFPARLGGIRGLQLAYIQNYRTKEFYGQFKRDVFGSISLGVMF
jgi:lipid A 3-O-deacylase